jgi:hypothetical protein
MEEIAQCINNITTIVAHPTPGRAKKCYSTQYLVAQFQYNKSDDTMSQGEILKTTGDGTRKAVELNKAVISSKIPNTLAKIVQNIYAPVEQQVEKLTEAGARR